MKKVLFASTALVAAGMMGAGSASAAEKIQLQLGGFAKWWVVGAWNEDSYQTGLAADYANVDVKGDVEVHFAGSTTLDNGLKVGVKIELEGGGVTQHTTDAIDKSFAYIESGFGKVIIGTEANGTKLLHVTAPEAAGNWNGGVGSISNGQAIGKPANVNIQNETAINTDDNSEKITYVAPSFMGLTVGGTYAGNATSQDDAGVVTAAELFGVGALYANTFGGVGLKVSAGVATYDAANATQGTVEFATGAQISYAGFTLGGSYKTIRNNYMGSGATTVDNSASNVSTSTDAKVWDVGVSYASGPYSVSLAFFNSAVVGSITDPDDDELTIYQASLKYNMGPGVDVLASVGHGEYDDEADKGANTDNNHNEGWVVMTGLSLAF